MGNVYYLEDESRELLVDELVDKFFEKDMIFFVKASNGLYNEYTEELANGIMRDVRKRVGAD